MKKKVKNQSGLSQIEKIKKNLSKINAVKECCSEVFYAFECPGGFDCVPYMTASDFIEKITPWENLIKDEGEENNDFEKLYDAIKVSFAVGYACGQLLDTHDAEVELILEAMREEKALLYLPHKKKAA